MSDDAHSADHSGAYRNVLISLLIATVITVYFGVKVHFESHAMNIVIGIIIAVVKASLVVAIFMHMKYEKRWWLGLVLFPILLVMIIIFSNFDTRRSMRTSRIPSAASRPRRKSRSNTWGRRRTGAARTDGRSGGSRPPPAVLSSTIPSNGQGLGGGRWRNGGMG